ncbi:CinA family protein [Polymorphum gilvum]|uniref:CinA-like protein n=1 Tax=Polymorphum gilvum (strain LMG 25793 / CGMCC 1.9160 / SL003B-26A1) TaxID=991905 RepID=F2J0Q0_POLGS|nr:CinA family protein [Polymorphum gilvum]ADZ70736.1 CinA-like protein [Polymorphum gilvum SL003B-26A1]
MTDIASLLPEAEKLVAACRTRGVMLAAAESCTGGLLCGLLTEVSGASAVLDRGFVTYSNEAKADMLGVPADLIERHGAVSREVALAMATGALARSRADIAVSITGIAGPGGGSADKPVGTVHFALATRSGTAEHSARLFDNAGRAGIRRDAIRHALELVSNAIFCLKQF